MNSNRSNSAHQHEAFANREHHLGYGRQASTIYSAHECAIAADLPASQRGPPRARCWKGGSQAPSCPAGALWPWYGCPGGVWGHRYPPGCTLGHTLVNQLCCTPGPELAPNGQYSRLRGIDIHRQFPVRTRDGALSCMIIIRP